MTSAPSMAPTCAPTRRPPERKKKVDGQVLSREESRTALLELAQDLDHLDHGAADGDAVTIEGTLTTWLGVLEGGRGGFVQDETGGIALYLAVPAADAWPAGTHVRAEGTVASRYGQRTLKLAPSE